MKVVFKSILIVGVAFALQTTLPWWSILLVSFFVNVLIYSNGISSFGSGFIGISLLWFIKALSIDISTNSILSGKIATLFSLPNSFLLILATALIGGVAAGFAGLAGSHFRSMIKRKRKDYYYG